MSDEPTAPELIILGDLHLGRGPNPRTGRRYRLEAFFYDDEFAEFCAWLCSDAAARAARLRLILIGDVFDLLRVDADLDDDGSEPRFEPVATPEAAAALVGAILAGHPGVVGGLARLLGDGHEVVFLPGNHDTELQWTAPQERVREALCAALPGDAGAARARVTAGLRFEPWFHHEPGRIWIEHGSQYDPAGSFRYPLRDPELPVPASALERDLPLGNFFQRYMFNGFGAAAFLVPSSDASHRYMKWMLLHRPRRIARAAARYVPFAWRFLRRLGRAAIDGNALLRRRHQQQLARLAERSGLGDTLERIDGLKDVRTDVGQAARATALHAGQVLLAALALVLLGAGLSYLTIEGPRVLAWGFAARLALYLAMSVLVALVGAAGLLYLVLREGPAPAEESMPHAAGQLARLLDVPLVVFGHTHAESVQRLARPSGEAWYWNTGTWIAVFARDVLLPRQTVQHSFLRVQGTRAELLHFDPARGGPRPAILIDETGD